MSTEALPEIRDSLPLEKPALREPHHPHRPPVKIQEIPGVADSPPAETEFIDGKSIVMAPRPYASTLTPEQRAEIAGKASRARWNKEINWETCSIEEGQLLIAEMRAELEKGSERINRRMSEQPISIVYCYNPNCVDAEGKRTIINVGSGRFAGMRTRKNFRTGLDESAFACSAACFMYMTKHFVHGGG